MAPPHLTGDQYGDPQGGTFPDGGTGSHAQAPYRPQVPGAAPYGDDVPGYGPPPQAGPPQGAGGPHGFAAQGGGFGAGGFPDASGPYGGGGAPGYGDHGFGGGPDFGGPGYGGGGYGEDAFGGPDAGRADHGEDDDFGDDEPDEPLVRPYAMTGGRTRPRYQLAIEALVSTTAQASQTGLLPEHQRITALCGQVKSVAEISALLSIPLGVARILVADLAEAGVVAIHQPGSTEAGQPDVTLLERVLSGLRNL